MDILWFGQTGEVVIHLCLVFEGSAVPAFTILIMKDGNEYEIKAHDERCFRGVNKETKEPVTFYFERIHPMYGSGIYTVLVKMNLTTGHLVATAVCEVK